MDISQQLKQLDLNQSEITIYLYLLKEGLSTPPQIASGTKIARTNCYNVLQKLKNKKLIVEQKNNARKLYLAKDPQSLLFAIEEKKLITEQLIPDLRALYVETKNKPKIQFFEGLEQVKEIYMNTLRAKKIYGFGSTKTLSMVAPQFYTKYLKELKNKNIVFYDVLTSGSQTQGAPEMKLAMKGLYEVLFLPEKYKDQPTDVIIWNDHVALITLRNPIFGTVITSPLIVETFNIIFNLIWTHQSL